jgi:hypothetical protein
MPTLVIQYPVQNGQPVLVDVLIGDLQPGGTTIFLDADEKHSQDGDIMDFAIGSGQELRGRTMVVSTVVLDRNPITDFTSTVVSLDGGSHPHVDVPQSDNPGNGGTSGFITIVNFV